jgi:hypothetical protein
MKIMTQLRAAGEAIADEDLARISPLMYQHVIPNGTYHFSRAEPRDDTHEAAIAEDVGTHDSSELTLQYSSLA